MPIKGLSVRSQDNMIWATTESLAYRNGFHVSRLVAALLYQYCCEMGEQPRLRAGSSRLARNGTGALVPVDCPEDVAGDAPPPRPAPVKNQDEVRTMTLQGLVEASGQSKAPIQRRINSGEIPHYFSGGTLLIDAKEATEYLLRCEAEQAMEWADLNLPAD